MRIHVTNGDSAGQLIQRVVQDEPVLPWRDILHEGPVPEGLTLEALSAVRASFIAGRGWAGFAETLAQFTARDAHVRRFQDYVGITLWFEHDLFDQLQLLQILDLTAVLPGVPGRVSLVQTDRYLGAMSVAEIAAVRTVERPVSSAQFELARRAWAAFCAATPEPMAALLAEDLAPLPWLGAALMRLLAELPGPEDGLGRTERLLLRAILGGAQPLAALYGAVQAHEPAVFMGDIPFYRRLEALTESAAPLISGLPAPGIGPADDRLRLDGCMVDLTSRGRQVLAGEIDWALARPWSTWLGGTAMRPTGFWRWNEAARQLTPEPIVRP